MSDNTTPQSQKFDKFLFDNDFFEISVEPGSRGPRGKQPEVDVEQIKNEAFSEGYAQGREEATQALKADMERHLQAITTNLDNMAAVKQQFAEIAGHEVLVLVRHVLSHAFDDIAEKMPEELLKKTLEQTLLPNLANTPLVVRLHAESLRYMEHLKEELGLKDKEGISYKTDASLAPGDVIVEWETGGVDARLSHLKEEIDKIFAAASTHPMPLEAKENAPAQPETNAKTAAETAPAAEASAPETGTPAEEPEEASEEEKEPQTAAQ